MAAIYVVWDATESLGGEREAYTEEEDLEQRVAILDNSEDACDLAVQEYKGRLVNQLVVEIRPDGGKKIISFVGELKEEALNSYVGTHLNLIRQMRAAVAAGVALMIGRMNREED